MFRSLALAAALFLAQGCNDHLVVTPDGSVEIVPSNLKTAPLNYATLYSQILEPRCTKCHNPKDPSDASLVLFSPYSELANSRKWKAPSASSKVVRVITDKGRGRMPPLSEGNGLTADEIDYISRYIDAGMPEL